MSFRIITIQDMFFRESSLQLSTMAEEIRDEARRRACVIGAVMCSVSYLECVINGLYEYAVQTHVTKLHRALASVWSEAFDRQPVLTKYQLALALAHKQMFDKGVEPYQSVATVLLLRNAIAHPKEIVSSRKQQLGLEKALRYRFAFGPKEENREEFFPDRCLVPECAKWALRSASTFVGEFKRRMPPRAFLFGRR